MRNRSDLLIRAVLKHDDLQAYCDALTRVKTSSSLGRFSYEPTVVIGTQKVTKEDKIELAFAGFVLGEVQGRLPDSGIIVGKGGKVHRVRLEENYKDQRKTVRILKGWVKTSTSEHPPVILSEHCSCCSFRRPCSRKADETDDLSVLNRMTPKLLQKYHKKGIFTVNQLSYLFKPRRRRKRTKTIPIRFSLELQALAIRTGKIYIQELPQITRQPIELFLDIEGIPDDNFHYLIGLLVCQEDQCQYHSFWANTIQDEQRMWNDFNEKMMDYPEVPIYHFGSYEKRALDAMGRKYHIHNEDLHNCLENITPHIFGKIYFPTRSNRLKELGRFIGVSWTSPNASGLQSLVWRYRWEETQKMDLKTKLLTYNEEDCEAVRLLHLKLVQIKEVGDSQENIDFADTPKRNATPKGNEIHKELEHILRSAHADYQNKKISFRSKNDKEGTKERKKGIPKGQGYRRKMPSRVRKIVQVEATKECPKHIDESLKVTKHTVERVIVDLHFTQNGCRKTITKYVGKKAYCNKCREYYNPPEMRKGRKWFGHAFQAWTIYQRIVLRLPYRAIIQLTEDLFNERTGEGTIVNFMRYFVQFYSSTERKLEKQLLESPFIHVDETPINIQGTNHYVWVFTDGKHVIFRMTETREATIVHDFLSAYEGILISDFYPGYDAVPCKQQKCWVHLIRDLNDDLWKAPFDVEFESFIFEVKTLLVPILTTAEKYGSKKRHFNKFHKLVERFYNNHIYDKEYHSEFAIKYQNRFLRYKESLFTFLEYDSIPWNNNMAERAIRHLAVQRKISGTFFKNVAPSYLLLLGIGQTCRFQNKSFLQFLISQEKDVDEFKARKPLIYSMKVGPDK